MYHYKASLLPIILLGNTFLCLTLHGETASNQKSTPTQYKNEWSLEEVCKDELTIDKVIYLALTNNAFLRSEYTRIGMIIGDNEKQQLLQNLISSTKRKSSIATTAADEMYITEVEKFLEILLSSIEIKIPQEKIFLKNELLTKMIDVIARTKIAFNTFIASKSIFELREQIAFSKTLAYEGAILLRLAGNTSKFELSRKKMEVERAKLATITALNFMTNSKENIDELVGHLNIDRNLRYISLGGNDYNRPFPPHNIKKESIQNNLKLQNLFERLKQKVKKLSIDTSRMLLPNLLVDHNSICSDTIPTSIFKIDKIHSNKDKSEIAYLWKNFANEALSIGSIAISALINYHTMYDEYKHVQDDLLSLSKKSFEKTLFTNNSMKHEIFDILKAKENILEQEITFLEKQSEFYSHKVFIQALLAGHLLSKKF